MKYTNNNVLDKENMEIDRETDNLRSTDHPDNHILSDRPDATRWFLSVVDHTVTSVKVKRDKDTNLPYISEVVDLDLNRHFATSVFWLPPSYLPYILNQWFTVLPEGAEGFHLTEDTQLWFFRRNGVELRDDKSDVSIPIPALKRAKVKYDLPGMVESSRSAVKEEVKDDSPPKLPGRLVTGIPAVGKTSLVRRLKREGVPAIDGDTYGHSELVELDNYTKLYHWVNSEMEEMIRSKNKLEMMDGVLDAMGALFAFTATQPEALIDDATEEYIRAQDERDRPNHYWRDPMLDIVQEPEMEEVPVQKEMFAKRYDGSGLKGNLVWGDQWMLDIDMIRQAVENGHTVCVIGSNWRDLFQMASDYKLDWYHLSLPNLGVVARRLDIRFAEYHATGNYPQGIKDWPRISQAVEAHDMLSNACHLGAKIVTSSNGRFFPRDLE